MKKYKVITDTLEFAGIIKNTEFMLGDSFYQVLVGEFKEIPGVNLQGYFNHSVKNHPEWFEDITDSPASIKKFVVLRDIPELKYGSILVPHPDAGKNGIFCVKDGDYYGPWLTEKYMLKFPDWFKPLKENESMGMGCIMLDKFDRRDMISFAEYYKRTPSQILHINDVFTEWFYMYYRKEV